MTAVKVADTSLDAIAEAIASHRLVNTGSHSAICGCAQSFSNERDQQVHAAEAVREACRPSIAEDIASKAGEIAANNQQRAEHHRMLALDPASTPKRKQHTSAAHAFRNRAEGAYEVANAIREMGAA